MPPNGKQDRDDSRDGQGDYVPAVFARSKEEAEEYRQLLDDYDIPAIIPAEEDEAALLSRRGKAGMSRGVPILVPEAMLDEASEVIADRDNADEFDVDEDDDGELDEDDEFLVEEEAVGELVEPPDDPDEEEDEDDDEEDEDFLKEDDSSDEDADDQES
jgi:hypothetical protein